MDEDRARWCELAALLPPARARDVVECWDIGEQEAGIDLLMTGLADGDVAIDDDERARIAVTAEVWGVRESVEPALRRCRSRPGGRVRTVEGEPAADAAMTAGAEPLTEAGGEPEADLVVVPWLACADCGRVLGRAHRLEPWGDLSYEALHYVLPPRRFGPEEAWEAFTALTACAHR
ncbi:hypothetical protein ADK67_13815 [Saccharothrix sp. NRRL B-16348]|uniref:hypothetical protein n=1 Tax=Saccharothrix sp. NRRL B-16348 TaxID=1415542 RepID=UPI0006AEAE41|nr:hypothetical protein [Saccharothrix sp. NRRL B-16348]KOX27509.1 hypothetical protein ADK67_13815 [Saccharothrix sp. NRRL B-16348]